MTELAYDFPAYSPGSLKLWQFEDGGTERLLMDQVEASRSVITAAALRRIDKGQVSKADVDRIDAAWLAIERDLEVLFTLTMADRLQRSARDRLADLRQASGVPWTDEVRALRAEIERLRHDRAGDVAKGRLAPEQAKQQLERLEAVHYLYWHQGFAWDGTGDALRAHADALATTVAQWDQPAPLQEKKRGGHKFEERA